MPPKPSSSSDDRVVESVSFPPHLMEPLSVLIHPPPLHPIPHHTTLPPLHTSTTTHLYHHHHHRHLHHCTLCTQAPAEADDDVASDDEGSECGIDPVDKEWMISASRCDMDNIHRLIATDPTLLNRKDFIFVSLHLTHFIYY